MTRWANPQTIGIVHLVMEQIHRNVSRRAALRGGAVAGVGLVTMALPSPVAAASGDVVATTTTTTTVAPAGGYSESQAADPNMTAINAVPVVTNTGSVEVSGSDTVG